MNPLPYIRLANATVGRLAPGVTARAARKMLMTPRPQSTRDWEIRHMETATRITLPNGLSTLQWGVEGAPIILCLHGWEGRGSQFGMLALPLAEAGYRVIALDAPAHGESPGREANPLVFRDALLDTGKALGQLELVIGHSMGASASALAIAQGLDTRSAVLVAGPASLRDVLNRFAGYFGLPDSARRRFLGIVESHTRAPLDTVEVSQLAKHFDMPALVVHDQDDPMVPFSDAGQIADHWPQARLLTTSGLGHFQALRDAQVISTIVTFAKTSGRWEAAA